jgi:hypothetical protein
MNREILDPKAYYYTDAIEDFDTFKKVWKELDTLEQYPESGVNVWNIWTASNDKDFIYGETKTFDINAINQLSPIFSPHSAEVAEKSKYIYDAIMTTMYNVCKDYASSLGDFDEPRLFPTFNIKKYNTGVGMGAHFDQLDGDKTLRYSLVMYLNDDCEGGEIFSKGSAPAVDLDYDVSVANKAIDFGLKPKENSVIIFPAFPPYFHTAHVVKSGFKYMIPGHWIHNNMDLNKNQGM